MAMVLSKIHVSDPGPSWPSGYYLGEFPNVGQGLKQHPFDPTPSIPTAGENGRFGISKYMYYPQMYRLPTLLRRNIVHYQAQFVQSMTL